MTFLKSECTVLLPTTNIILRTASPWEITSIRDGQGSFKRNETLKKASVRCEKQIYEQKRWEMLGMWTVYLIYASEIFSLSCSFGCIGPYLNRCKFQPPQLISYSVKIVLTFSIFFTYFYSLQKKTKIIIVYTSTFT